MMSQSISFSYKKELKKILKDFNPDYMIVHFPNPFVIHYILKLIKRKKNKALGLVSCRYS